MKTISILRLLRRKYGITTKELAEAAGVSHQYISDLELGKYLGKYNFRQSGEPLIKNAFANVVANRTEQARRLSEDFQKNYHRLLEFVEE